MSVLDQFRLDGKRALVTARAAASDESWRWRWPMPAPTSSSPAEPRRRSTRRLRRSGRAAAQAWTVQGRHGGAGGVPGRRASGSLDDLGPIDILINNVGNREVSMAIEAEPLETWQRSMDLNLTSCFLGTKLVGEAMLARGTGGRIINIASISALIANRGIGGRDYETGKGGRAALHALRGGRLGASRDHGQRHLPGPVHDRHQPGMERAAAGRDRGASCKNVPMGASGRARRDRPAGGLSREPRLELRDWRGVRHRRRIHGLVELTRHHSFRPAVQFSTKVTGSPPDRAGSSTRKRVPSAVTSYCGTLGDGLRCVWKSGRGRGGEPALGAGRR